MMKAGVPLLQSFDIIIEGLENPNMRKLVDDIKQQVAAGNSFAASLRTRPQYFDDLFCNLVDAGEQAGALENLLDRVATYKEKTEALKAKIKKAMNYPIAVVVVALIVTGILLIKVVPQFEYVFSSFGAELTRLYPVCCGTFRDFTGMVVVTSYLVSQGLIYALGETKKRSEKFRNWIDRVALKAPVVGDIIYKSSVARYARTLSTTFAAGVPLVEALDSVAGATGNIVFKNAVNQDQTGRQLRHAA